MSISMGESDKPAFSREQMINLRKAVIKFAKYEGMNMDTLVGKKRWKHEGKKADAGNECALKNRQLLKQVIGTCGFSISSDDFKKIDDIVANRLKNKELLELMPEKLPSFYGNGLFNLFWRSEVLAERNMLLDEAAIKVERKYREKLAEI